jgi:hypothetical protein
LADAGVTLYRALIPAHAAIHDDVVATFIGLASSQHSPAAFGTQFLAAMVYYGAHLVEKTPGLGSSLPNETNIVTGQSDGSVSRQYSMPSAQEPDKRNQWLQTTVYGQNYLAIRASILAGKPEYIGG